MRGLGEDASKVEVRNDEVSNHGTEQKNTHSQQVHRNRRWHRRLSAPCLPTDWGGEWSSHLLTMTRQSSESNQAGRTGSGLRVKVNLPIFKDEKTRDAVTYHSFWWDVAIFHCLGWDHQHFLLYIFWVLQGFPGDLARSLGEDATLSNILQTFNEHYSMRMMFDTLSKELYSIKQGSEESVFGFEVHLLQQVQILQSEYPGRIQ